MTCFLPFLSGILPRSVDDKLLVDVRGGGVEDTAEPGGFLGWFSGIGGGAKSSSVRGPSDRESEEEGPYEAYYRIWYGKGLIGFKPKSLGGTGAIPVARRLDELYDTSCSVANGAATSSETTDSPASNNGSPSKHHGHDWSKQTLVESQSQTEGRSLRNYWEERSHTTTMATPESISSPLKVVQVTL